MDSFALDKLTLANTVHIYQASLDPPQSQVEQLAAMLSQDELERAIRFRFERHRNQFIIGRGILRTLLAHYLGITPGEVHFRYGLKGKPYLADVKPPDSKGLKKPSGSEARQSLYIIQFNLAHAQNLAIYALTLAKRVGIDLEYLRSIPEMEQIAAKFFSTRERETLQNLPPDQKLEAFYNAWTRKEAYLKAIGEGLSHPLDQCEVTLAPGEPAQLIHIAGDESLAAHWSLHAFSPSPGYVATLAVEGNPDCILFDQFSYTGVSSL